MYVMEPTLILTAVLHTTHVPFASVVQVTVSPVSTSRMTVVVTAVIVEGRSKGEVARDYGPAQVCSRAGPPIRG